MRKLFTRFEIDSIALDSGFAHVRFETRVAKNGNHCELEVGYVAVNGRKELFCKHQPHMPRGTFYLCNEFEKLGA